MTEEHDPAPPGWLKDQLDRLEKLVRPELKAGRVIGAHVVVPAWRRVTAGEPRWQVTLAVAAAVALQFVVPQRLSAGPRLLAPLVEVGLGLALVIANPGRIERVSPRLRTVSLVLIAVMSLANAASALRLVVDLVNGTESSDAPTLLFVGGSIWATNVLVFALWYWELDRGGPVSRARFMADQIDFLFPQMQVPELAPPDWEPEFPDYLYLSFTNATAFSPTDTLPLTRWAKMLMLVQSVVSLSTVALVIARAVNVLK